MKILLFKFMVIFFLVVNPALATIEDEETSKYTQAIFPQQKTAEGDTHPSSIVTIESLPDELLLTVFRFVEIPDLGRVTQVSNRWKRVTETPDLWRFMGTKYYGDFLSPKDLSENPRQRVIAHYLSVVVNASEDLQQIEKMVRSYCLKNYILTYKDCLTSNFLTNLVSNLPYNEEFIAQCNEAITVLKLEGLTYGRNGYSRDPLAAKKFNDLLIKKGDLNAVRRKIEGLTKEGWITTNLVFRGYSHLNPFEGSTYESVPLYGYEINTQAAKDLNDLLVKIGDQEAIKRKIYGLTHGYYGYKKDPEAVKEFKKILWEKEDQETIRTKIEGLAYGYYGYEKDAEAATALNETLIKKRDQQAIRRKIVGLNNVGYGYEKNPSAAKDTIEDLINEGNLYAMWKKIEGLLLGKYGYQQDLAAAKDFYNILVKQKALGTSQEVTPALYYDLEKIFKEPDFLTFLISKGDYLAIITILKGLVNGTNGFQKNPVALKEFIESFAISEFPVARGAGKYLKAFGLKYGVSELGYELNRTEAFKFIRENHVPY